MFLTFVSGNYILQREHVPMHKEMDLVASTTEKPLRVEISSRPMFDHSKHVESWRDAVRESALQRAPTCTGRSMGRPPIPGRSFASLKIREKLTPSHDIAMPRYPSASDLPMLALFLYSLR